MSKNSETDCELKVQELLRDLRIQRGKLIEKLRSKNTPASKKREIMAKLKKRQAELEIEYKAAVKAHNDSGRSK